MVSGGLHKASPRYKGPLDHRTIVSINDSYYSHEMAHAFLSPPFSNILLEMVS
jgi:hypothetical protein